MTNITFIDLEINPTNRQILDIGAIRHDGASFHCNSPKDLMQFIAQTEYIGGHNILNHDLQYISPLFAQVGYKHPKVIGKTLPSFIERRQITNRKPQQPTK